MLRPLSKFIHSLFRVFLCISFPLFCQEDSPQIKSKINYQLTILTSVYRGKEFLEDFLAQIEQQTIYKNCQHIIANATPIGEDAEERVLLAFAKKHPNVEYYRLLSSPNLYETWNFCIKKCKSPFLVNANIDDRLIPTAYELLINTLAAHPEVDLVYSDADITSLPNQTIGNHQFDAVYEAEEFSYKGLQERCFIGSHPIWRTSLHNKIGLFDQTFYCAGDWELWLRAASRGSLFLHVPIKTGLNYSGPATLSNQSALEQQRTQELRIIHNRYPLSPPKISKTQAKYYSQYGQDRFLNEHYFKNKVGGVFVEIGAYDGKLYSNSLFFEETLGWRGICVEPNPAVFPLLKKNRPFALSIQGCIANKAGHALFRKIESPLFYVEMLGGLLDKYDPRHQERVSKEMQDSGGSDTVIEVSCFLLNDLLEDQKIYHIDLLSIDTEGGELEILQSIDFDRFDISIIQVENNYKSTLFREFLKIKGYHLIQDSHDEIYAKG